MQIYKFKEVKHLFPNNSWAVARQSSAGDMDNDLVLLLEGNLEVELLDLDYPKAAFPNLEGLPDEEMIMSILVQGNVKAKNIYNYETDGSTGLTVLGNLEADNMVVGGQEIYITGNLKVNECFWGEYNHGELKVNGTISAKVFVASDEYHIDFDRFQKRESVEIAHGFFEDDDDAFDRERLAAVFKPKCLMEEEDIDEVPYSWNDWLIRTTLLELLAENRSILIEGDYFGVIANEQVDYPELFDEISFANEIILDQQKHNFDRLFELLDDTYENETPVFEWNDFLITFDIKGRNDHTKEDTEAIYNQHKINAQRSDGLMVSFSRRPANASLKKIFGLLGKNEKIEFEVVHKEPGKDATYTSSFQSEYHDIAESIWKETLSRAEKGAYFFKELKEQVTVDELAEMLALPLCQEKYNDYNDADKQGFWQGRFMYCFRQNGHNDYPASFDISKEIQTEEFDIRTYFFRYDNIDDPGYVKLFYNSSQYERTTDIYRSLNDKQWVSLFDFARYQEALQWFAKAKKVIQVENRDYLEDKAALEIEQQELLLKRQTPKTVPFTEVVLGDVSFKVINLHQAHELVGDLIDLQGNTIYNVFEDLWRFNDPYNDGYFLWVEDDVSTEMLELQVGLDDNDDFSILGYIFSKSLSVKSHIVAYDTDHSPPLIVLGKVQAMHIHLFGNVHYFGGGLQCDSIWGEYNHGELFVKGGTFAWLVYADDMRMHFERFDGVGAIINLGRPDISVNSLLAYADGTTFNEENYLPSTHKLSDLVLDTLIDIDENGDETPNEEFSQYITSGRTVFDGTKEHPYKRKDFPLQLNEGFEYLCSLPEVKEKKVIVEFDEPESYFCQLFDVEGEPYRQLFLKIGSGFDIRLRATQQISSKETKLVLEYLDENNDSKYNWTGAPESEILELRCVKHAALKTIEKLKNVVN